MKKFRVLSLSCGPIILWNIIALILLGLASSPVSGSAQVGLYDVFEIQAINSNSYSNPFDFNEIELQADFTSPTGRLIHFFGFYDGDGNGGQTGNVWKLRFMPDELGTWNYSYTWTDRTPGGLGIFEVVDTGLPGPLKIASDNTWYFKTARGNPFHWRAYDIHSYMQYRQTDDIVTEVDAGHITDMIQTEIVDRGYNFTMLNGASNRLLNLIRAYGDRTFWLNTTDTNVFDIGTWKAWDTILTKLKDNGVYAILFSFIRQPAVYGFTDFQIFLRYWLARCAPYYNFFGWSPTWEWHENPPGWSTSEVNQIMNYLQNNDPFDHLLSIHDHSNNAFNGWLDFSMRQLLSNTLNRGNQRSGGYHGGTGSAFLDQPIIGSEDIWESTFDSMPRNATEVRRAAWGIQMAGVMPLYSEWTPDPPPTGGNGEGEPEVRRMFDFFYSETRYRQYQQLNNLVSSSARQIASGTPGIEYLVYDEDGGSINIDLSGTSSSNSFSVLWFDPKNGSKQNGGSINGGDYRSLSSPFSGDTVLLLGGLPPDTTPPSVPQNLNAIAASQSQIDLTWQAASDPESGIAGYKIYRNNTLIGQSNTTSFSDTGLSEGIAYTYEVSAVNGAGLESASSNPISETTLSDTTPPTIDSVSASGNPTIVKIVFSEPVEETSAINVDNYNIDNSITVSAVSLAADLKTVTLTTSPHLEGITYTLTVNNVKDRASTPNILAPNTTVTYTFVAQLTISDLTVASGKNYEIVPNGLVDGALVYIDRDYTFNSLPSGIESATYIKTANDDKGSNDNPFISFSVNQNVTIYVAYDDYIPTKPSWLQSFNDTGEDLGSTSINFSLYAKDFPAGKITLGGNEGDGYSMYAVIAVGQGTKPIDLPPSPPTGLKVISSN